MKTNYKKIEIEIREIVLTGRGTAWDIATRCVKLLSESDSYAQAIGISPDHVVKHLDEYLADYAVNLESIVTMLKVFPEREQWNKPLLILLGEAHAVVKSQAKQEADESPQRTRSVVKKVEFEAVEKRAVTAESEAAKLRREVERLKTENELLRQQVATLKGQVAELRKSSRWQQPMVTN